MGTPPAACDSIMHIMHSTVMAPLRGTELDPPPQLAADMLRAAPHLDRCKHSITAPRHQELLQVASRRGEGRGAPGGVWTGDG